MKKILSLFIALISLTSFSFAERFFEVKIDAPITLSNDTFTVSDIINQNITMDLSSISKLIPEKGLNVDLSAYPSIGASLRIANIRGGLYFGIDGRLKLGMTKDFFDLLGKGADFANISQQSLDDLAGDIRMNIQSDAFAHFDLLGEFSIGDFKIKAMPSFFAPLWHIAKPMNESSATTLYKDLANGKFSASIHENLEFYSCYNPEDNFSMNFNGLGFDLGATVEYPLIEDKLLLIGNIHTPIIPGRLTYKSGISIDWDMNIDLQNIYNSSNADMGVPEADFSLGESCTYYLNRPFKLSAQADYSLLGQFLVLSGRLGFGVRNPFKGAEAHFYPEYLLGVTTNLGSIFKAGIATEYTEEVYKHSLVTALNVRLFELDLAASLASPTFSKSFNGSGFSFTITSIFGF